LSLAILKEKSNALMIYKVHLEIFHFRLSQKQASFKQSV